ncbi:MAG: TonB-dependent receptor [Chryseobacterium sp.]|nr:TonB-dependent receptor [Candidatus Chryseobacterium enterohippi]
MKKITTSLLILSTATFFAQSNTKSDSLKHQEIEIVEIFGDRNKKQRGLETVTRMPVNPQLQPQSISTISEKLIEDQGALTITDVARNVPGVTLFGSYGGNRESMSIRGFRGTPVLKNGIRMDSDFRTGAGVFDMQGIESVQVIRGAAAITQGLGNGLGSGGGLINMVTKTPRYYNDTELSVRAGSWNLIRNTLDAQRVFGKKQNIGIRLNAAYEQSDSYRDIINKNKFYINPSVSWKIDDKTELIAEMDYLDGQGTPDRGTVNTKANTENGLVDMGSRFLGFKNDTEEYKTLSYSARITRELTNKISVRGAFMSNIYERDAFGVALTGSGDTRNRALNRNYKDDRNNTLQIDVMGKDFTFGKFKWEWQVGYDITNSKSYSESAATGVIDKINVSGPINNDTQYTINDLKLNNRTDEKMSSYGFMTQQHLTYANKFKLIGALRYSYTNDYHEGAVDPMVGLMYMPTNNINIYGTYSTITSLRQMGSPMIDGTTSGPAVTDQFEVGVKTSWFEDRLRANFNYFNMNQSNLTVNYYNPVIGAQTDLYEFAGNLRRRGLEAEVTGRILPNLQVLLGYSYTDAAYNNSPAYVEGSRPMNSPYNTANAWAQYTFQNTKTFLDGAYISLGYYYIGSRPINEQSKTMDAHGNWNGGAKQFLMPEYYTLNAQVGYKYKQWTFRVLANNLTDRIGYNSYYRGGYINQIDPFNMSGQVSFNF